MLQGDQVVSPAPLATNTATTRFRWLICGLLFYATTVNYMDRVVMGILKDTISHDLGWTETDYGLLTSAFQIGYAVMLPIAGRVIDWLGLRIGYSLAVVVWALSSMAHSFAGNLFQFTVARVGLGLGEAANFPAAIKTVAHWFPSKERALATGIFNSGTNVGALVGALLVPIVATKYGWHSAFLVTGGFSLSWLLFWLLLYKEPEKHPRVSESELALIHADHEPEAKKIPYLTLTRNRAALAFLLGKFFTDPVWWFYLFWIPGFLKAKYQVDLLHIGPPLVAIYLIADVGSVGGGWLSSQFLKRGWSVNAARKTTMLIFALSVTPIMLVPASAGNLWLTVLLIGIAAGAHQGWSANLFTMSSDCFPRSAVGSVVGLGGLGGALGGAFVQYSVGKWLDFSHGFYSPLFFFAGVMYLFSLGLISLLVPRIRQQNL